MPWFEVPRDRGRAGVETAGDQLDAQVQDPFDHPGVDGRR
jgi:hypothetical protein